MAFEVPIVRIGEVLPIAGADNIEAVTVGDYRSIVRKSEYKAGDLVAYIPEASIVPLSLLQEMGLEGKLHGSNKNRVKAIKLRGTLSQGLVYPVKGVFKHAYDKGLIAFANNVSEEGFPDGYNVADILGITKYEPEPPAQFRGRITRPRGDYELINYDIENIKKLPNLIEPGELVEFTEKIHGTLMQAVYWPKTGEFAVSSKGLGAQGFVIEDNEANAANTYLKAAKKYALAEKIQTLLSALSTDEMPDAVFVLGEVFGRGIQDLAYNSDLAFRVFDFAVVTKGERRWFTPNEREFYCTFLGLDQVPVLYRGPFSKEVLEQYTNGLETVSGHGVNIREGVVVKPLDGRRDPRHGRVVLKSVSETYLLRKAGTEYN